MLNNNKTSAPKRSSTWCQPKYNGNLMETCAGCAVQRAETHGEAPTMAQRRENRGT